MISGLRAAISLAITALLWCVAAIPALARIGGTAEEFQRDFTRELGLQIHERRTEGLLPRFDMVLAYRGKPGTFLAAKIGTKRGLIVSQSVLIGVKTGDREHAAQAVTVIARFFQEAADLADKNALRLTGALIKQVMSTRARAAHQVPRARLSLVSLPASQGIMWHAMAEK